MQSRKFGIAEMRTLAYSSVLKQAIHPQIPFHNPS